MQNFKVIYYRKVAKYPITLIVTYIYRVYQNDRTDQNLEKYALDWNVKWEGCNNVEISF